MVTFIATTKTKLSFLEVITETHLNIEQYESGRFFQNFGMALSLYTALY